MSQNMAAYSTPASGNNQGFDFGAWLQSLAQTKDINQKNIPGNDSYLASQASPTGLPPQAIEAANKVLNKQYTQHAETLATSPEGMAVLQKLVDVHNAAQPQEGEGSTDTPTPPPSASAPKQNTNFGYKPDNPISSFFNMLGITPTPEAQVQLTQAALNRQKIASGQPAEIALPAAQASGLLQEQAGEKPIQPEQAAQLRAQQNLAQITAMNDSIKNLQERRNSLNTEFDQEGKTMSILGRAGGLLTFQGQQMTPRQKAIKVEQNGIDKVIARMQSRMTGFNPENPAALKGGGKSIPSAPQGATHYSPSTGKFYNAQGQEIK